MIQRTLEIASKKLPKKVVIVYSASGKTTDHLVTIGEAARNGNKEAYESTLEQIITHHKNICNDLSISQETADDLLEELRHFTQGLLLLKEVTKRSFDSLLSFGEFLSTRLVYAYAMSKNLSVEYHDSRTFLKTDNTFGNAQPNMPRTKELLKQRIGSSSASIHIVQGFIGSTEGGVCTTLGRGGSDYTASLCAAALDAEVLEVWTDVPGIMTSDPRIVSDAQPLSALSYQEAAELAYFGAKVLHPATIQPAVEKAIPVVIKNTNEPELPGTNIGPNHTPTIKALTSKSSLTLVQVHSSRMLNNHGFLSGMFTIFNEHKISVDIVATSEVSITVSLEIAPDDKLLNELSRIGKIIVLQNQTCLCAVGYRVWRNANLLSKVFSAFGKDIPITLISLGGSENNLTIVIPDSKQQIALERLHTVLFG